MDGWFGRPIHRATRRTLPREYFCCHVKFFYPAAELPASLQTYKFYRLPQGGGEWKLEDAVVTGPDDLPRYVTEGVFPIPWFDNLRIGPDRLLYAVRYGYRKGPRDRAYGQVKSPWLTAAVFYPYGVWPQLARLASGVVVLSFGRPGVDLLFSRDVHGQVWEHHIHVPEVSGTCSYTGLLATAPDRCLLAYSRWPFKNAKGGACKAIILREIRVTRLPAVTY